jgi:vitamin B12 transporter
MVNFATLLGDGALIQAAIETGKQVRFGNACAAPATVSKCGFINTPLWPPRPWEGDESRLVSPETGLTSIPQEHGEMLGRIEAGLICARLSSFRLSPLHINKFVRESAKETGIEMRKIALAALASLATPIMAVADDTEIDLHPLFVTANRIPMARDNINADITVITRQDLERAGQSTLADVLRTAPGIETWSNGGPGLNASVSIRGTNSTHVVVLMDGVRIGSVTSGTTLFEDIALDQIDHIEVVRGAASSLYGSDAIGGVIQIFTKKTEGSPHLSASIGYGSYNTHKESAGVSGSVDATQYALNVSATHTDGISPIRPSADRGDPQNGPAAYRNFSVTGLLSHQIADGHKISLSLYDSFNKDQYNDLSYIYGSTTPEPRPYEQKTQRSIQLASEDKILTWWESKLTIGEGQDSEFSSSSLGKSTYNSYQRQYGWLNTFTLPIGKLLLGYDLLKQHVRSTADFNVDHRLDRGYMASYLLSEGPHTLQMSVRRDDNSQFGNHDTGNVSYGYRFAPQWKVTGAWGTAFKAPTFDDLYFRLPGFYVGNPNLKPETSNNKELALAYDNGHHTVTTTVYKNDIKNLIGYTDNYATTQNVSTATIEGLTVAYEGWVSTYHFKANADFQDPRDNDTEKLLARRGRVHGYAFVGQSIDKLEIGAELVGVGKRYDDAANTNKLGGYALLNLTAKYDLDKQWSLSARLNNALDKQYDTALVSGIPYNNPGANLFVALSWHQ